MSKINYKDVFNNIVEAEESKRTETKMKADKAEADLYELKGIIEEVTDTIEEEVIVDYREDEDMIQIECEGNVMIVKLETTDRLELVVSEDVIEFESEVTVRTQELDRFIADILGDSVIYDKGADIHSKEDMIECVLEQVAKVVLKSRG